MTIDGFRPDDTRAFASFDPVAADRAYGLVAKAAQRLRVEVEGVGRLPSGRALVVANHAFGFDVTFAIAEVWRAQRRPLWVLGEHVWWRLPFLRRVVAAVGTVDGTPENAERLLGAGELVLVLPGGLRESVKPRELRYRLLWGHRYGFVRAAIATSAPVVPLACLGADELFSFVGDAFDRGERLLGWRGFPVPRPSLSSPLPRFSRFRFVFGAPIDLRARPEDADDPATLRRARHEIAGALHELLDEELARRAGVTVDESDPAQSSGPDAPRASSPPTRDPTRG